MQNYNKTHSPSDCRSSLPSDLQKCPVLPQSVHTHINDSWLITESAFYTSVSGTSSSKLQILVYCHFLSCVQHLSSGFKKVLKSLKDQYVDLTSTGDSFQKRYTNISSENLKKHCAYHFTTAVCFFLTLRALQDEVLEQLVKPPSGLFSVCTGNMSFYIQCILKTNQVLNKVK